MPNYRPDIDILRAIAVLSVIGFHWKLTWITGGYVGVDIFFVISGYLIFRTIVDDIAAERFSFVRFYERRIRRILPALYVTMLATLGVGWFLMMPPFYLELGQSVASGIFFSSNIFFYNHVGYFDSAAMTKPLLHTWSLAVEEQFYLAFPPLIWLAARHSSRHETNRSLVALAFLVSVLVFLLISQLLLMWQPSAAFYLAPSRAWEFLLGAFTSWGIPRPLSRRARLTTLALGLALMAGAIFGFRPETPFPGLAASVPCLGAGFFLAGSDAPNQTLFPRPIARVASFVGRISYSLYLIHWPLLVLVGLPQKEDHQFGSAEIATLFGATVVLSYLMYRYVEQPFRIRRESTQRALVIKTIAGCSAILLVSGLAVDWSDGFSMRFGARLAKITSFRGENVRPFYRVGRCFLTPRQPFSSYDQGECLTGQPGTRNVLLWGDSIAAHYYPGLANLSEQAGFHLMQATSAACAPFLQSGQHPASQNCLGLLDLVASSLPGLRPTVVLLSANWRYYAKGSQFRDDLDRTLSSLRELGLSVILFGPSIEYTEPVPRMLFQHRLSSSFIEQGGYVSDEILGVDDRMRNIALAHSNVRFVSVLRTMCPDRRCPLLAAFDEPLEWDFIHLTPSGSKLVIGKLADQIVAGIVDAAAKTN